MCRRLKLLLSHPLSACSLPSRFRAVASLHRTSHSSSPQPTFHPPPVSMGTRLQSRSVSVSSAVSSITSSVTGRTGAPSVVNPASALPLGSESGMLLDPAVANLATLPPRLASAALETYPWGCLDSNRPSYLRSLRRRRPSSRRRPYPGRRLSSSRTPPPPAASRLSRLVSAP